LWVGLHILDAYNELAMGNVNLFSHSIYKQGWGNSLMQEHRHVKGSGKQAFDPIRMHGSQIGLVLQNLIQWYKPLLWQPPFLKFIEHISLNSRFGQSRVYLSDFAKVVDMHPVY
jgi:hypothetical protein